MNKAKDKGILPYEIGQLKIHFMLWKVYAIIIKFGGDFFPRACFPFVLFPVLALASVTLLSAYLHPGEGKVPCDASDTLCLCVVNYYDYAGALSFLC